MKKRTKFLCRYPFTCTGCGNKVEVGDIATYSAYEKEQVICEDCGDLEDEH